jgi:hypothetical protein
MKIQRSDVGIVNGSQRVRNPSNLPLEKLGLSGWKRWKRTQKYLG